MFRNNVGFDADRKIHYGLCTGSSDLIGWTRKTVTQDMVGKEVAIFTAIEIKTPGGRGSTAQKHFLLAVGIEGGLAGYAHSEEDAINIILEK